MLFLQQVDQVLEQRPPSHVITPSLLPPRSGRCGGKGRGHLPAQQLAHPGCQRRQLLLGSHARCSTGTKLEQAWTFCCARGSRGNSVCLVTVSCCDPCLGVNGWEMSQELWMIKTWQSSTGHWAGQHVPCEQRELLAHNLVVVNSVRFKTRAHAVAPLRSPSVTLNLSTGKNHQ